MVGVASPRLLVISPHFDDAVLSCGALLAGQQETVVCTVFAAAPRTPMQTSWDTKSGFSDSSATMRARAIEDEQALAVLGAHPVHLPFCDAQYGESPSHEMLVEALARVVAEVPASTVFIPLGLFHSDHVLVSNACVAVLERLPERAAHAYEDVPYRNMTGLVHARLRELPQLDMAAHDGHAHGDAAGAARREAAKQEALRAYASQLRAFDCAASEPAFIAERHWRLTTLRKRHEWRGPLL